MNIRLFKKEDYSTVSKWGNSYNEPYPRLELLPETTYIIEDNNNLPVFCLSLILTNTPICYLEFFTGDPEYRQDDRHALSQKLLDFALTEAKRNDCQYSIILAYKDKIKNRYQEMGMTKTLDNLSGFVKELKNAK